MVGITEDYLETSYHNIQIRIMKIILRWSRYLEHNSDIDQSITFHSQDERLWLLNS